MSFSKLLFIVSYLLIGVYLVFLYPKLNGSIFMQGNKPRQPKETGRGINAWPYILISLIAIAASILLPWSYITLTLLICLIFQKLDVGHVKRNWVALFLALITASFLPWWLHNSKNRLDLSFLQSLSFFSLTLFVYWVLSKPQLTKLSRKLSYEVLPFGLFIGILLMLTFTPGIGLVTTSFGQWHHWGAYIGPAELVLNGAIPFNDIPLQYGFGPTIIIAAACATSCWNAFYWSAGIGTTLITLALAYIAIKIYQPKNIIEQAIILLIVLLCSIFYTAYPANLLSVLATPSTSGLRFLPGVLMLCLIVHQITKKDNRDTIANTSTNILEARHVPMHLLWIASFLWAPEAAIQTSVLWIPYCAWSRLYQLRGLSLTLGALKLGLQFFLLFIVALIGFSTLFLLHYGEWPILSTYFVYLLYPPGPMPINPNGTIWFVLMCTILWFLWARCYQKQAFSDPKITQSMWAIALLCFANFTYYIGRSHDNNILNLLPYFSLLLMGISRWSEKSMTKIISTVMLSSIVGWSILIDFTHYELALRNHVLLDKSPTALIASFNRELDSTDQYLQAKTAVEIQKNTDARKALHYLYRNTPEAVETYDKYFLIDAGQRSAPWSAFHGPLNFYFIPSALRQRYLQNIAKRFRRSGWILYDKNFEINDYLRDYDAVYQRTQELDFGTYYAIRYSPKP
ncbi:hypothetical protein G6674_01615 [Polynucleobacter paneuropaeus]|nr:hypothetical protein G6674_01615 [Polynucleobacter paneuropaeus]